MIKKVGLAWILMDPFLITELIKEERAHEIKKFKEEIYWNLSRVELPAFCGDNPRCWIRKCEKFFKMNFISI